MIRHFILLLTSFILAMFVQPPLCFATLGQKVGVSLASSSYNKTTETAKNSRSGSSSVGIASEYSLFLRNDLGVFGQIEMNLGGGGGILFLGGAGGVKWYISGGENTQYRDSHLSIRTNSKLNTLSGLGGRRLTLPSKLERRLKNLERLRLDRLPVAMQPSTLKTY